MESHSEATALHNDARMCHSGHDKLFHSHKSVLQLNSFRMAPTKEALLLRCDLVIQIIF